MPRVNVSSILDPSKGKDKDTGLQTIIDPSAVSAINPRSWPSVEQTVLNGPQVGWGWGVGGGGWGWGGWGVGGVGGGWGGA